ncbi:FAD-dependent oxidoreductase [Fodinibius sediminis]|uniref:FAD dependent oxidoreductase n=1 Tax=Fodinibius sediminis TaxID=1214077 RepID=A0A521BAG5_9BACT|nr:FAD-dependent oxidoreductase [Fodinibius sediminis]SMO44063.1 FAD dependent oxidoreductase [Fodinibius sediminis]
MIFTTQRFMLLIIAPFLIAMAAACGQEEPEGPETTSSYDIVIYGGTSAGVAAAIQSSRMDKSVVLIEPGQRIGGLTTGGLGATDIGNKFAIGGIAREFYENIHSYYENPSHWHGQSREEYLGDQQGRTDEGEKAMWTFEPSAALQVYKEMMAAEEIDLARGERLQREGGVQKKDGTISRITMESGRTFEGKVFLDATYEGDLMAAAGVSYEVGRESSDTYDESLNGVQLYPEGLPDDIDSVKVDYFSRVPRNRHQFPDGVDPYREKGNPDSGLLWGISSDTLASNGTGDEKVQAYNFRLTLTDDPDNRIPITRPADYDSTRYELLARLFEAQPEHRDINDYFIWTRMPNRKTDVNNRGGFSTDMIGRNHQYPEASYEQRREIIQVHENYTKGLLYFYKTDPRVPEQLQSFIADWGYPKDEFLKNDHFTPQLYVREARRMEGEYVMTQSNVTGTEVVPDSIGMAAYGMDSHHIQRIITGGMVKNEGDIQVHGYPPYPISYRSLTPKADQASNLLVPVALSASHIAFGSIRMEPVFMVLGQSAATAAAIAVEDQVAVQQVDYSRLRRQLQKDGQVLEHE